VEITVMSGRSIGGEGLSVSDSTGRRRMMSATSSAARVLFERDSIAMAILVVGLAASVLVIGSPPGGTPAATVVTDSADKIQRNIDASATRYTALAKYSEVRAERRAGVQWLSQ
jgi:hypothetical protein